MMLIERMVDVLLGEKVPPPAGLTGAAVPAGITFRRGALIPRIGGILGRMAGPAAAVTLGRMIVLRPDVEVTDALIAHELEHVRQWRNDPLFPARYTIATFWHGYWNNPYEIEARRAESAAATPPTENPA
jgi:hypothetical protein